MSLTQRRAYIEYQAQIYIYIYETYIDTIRWANTCFTRTRKKRGRRRSYRLLFRSSQSLINPPRAREIKDGRELLTNCGGLTRHSWPRFGFT